MSRPSTPLHLRWEAIGLVVAGGAVGTLLRSLLALVVPAWGGMPLGIFIINVTGAFVLGWLLEALTRSGPDTGGRRTARLLVGTGVLGGYTTYSTFAVGTDGLLLTSQVAVGALYGLATVVVGAAASVAGVAAGAALARRRGSVR